MPILEKEGKRSRVRKVIEKDKKSGMELDNVCPALFAMIILHDMQKLKFSKPYIILSNQV